MAAPPLRLRAPRRHRYRPGSLDRPVSGRLYRAAGAFILLPLLVAAFSVARPEPLPPPTLPPSFDEEVAVQLAEDLARSFPDRSPGSEGARGALEWVERRLAEYRLSITRHSFTAEIPGRGRVVLTNLIATSQAAAGRSPQAIALVAHRDNSGRSPGANDNASGTAALIELARDLATSGSAHTLVFVSTDGGAFGGLGAAALARNPTPLEQAVAASVATASGRGPRGELLAVVGLDALSGHGPVRLEFGGDAPRTASATLLATAQASVLAQTGRSATQPTPLGQIVDLAFPFSLYEQAPFVGRGVSALTLTSAGDRPPPTEGDVPSALDRSRLGDLGRAAQALVASLDAAAEAARGTGSYVSLGERLIRGWTVQFVLLVGFLPVLVATADLLARGRRRRLRLGPALRAYRSRLGVWIWIGGLFTLFSVGGVLPEGAERPLSPETETATSWPVAPLLALAGLSTLGWLVARVRLMPRGPVPREQELAGHLAAMLVLCVIGLVMAAVNPYSLLLVLPSLHAWLWVPHMRGRGLAARAGLYALGFLGPFVLLASFALRYDLGLDAPWYLAALVSVGYAPVPLTLAFLAWGAAAGQIGALVFGRYTPYPSPAERPVRGPIRETVRRTALFVRRRRRARTDREDERLRTVEE